MCPVYYSQHQDVTNLHLAWPASPSSLPKCVGKGHSFIALQRLQVLHYTTCAPALASMPLVFCASTLLPPSRRGCSGRSVWRSGRRAGGRVGCVRWAICSVETFHAYPLQQRGQRPYCRLRHQLPFLYFEACCHFTFASLPHAVQTQLKVWVELAYMVDLARAYSVMHANASSGRPRREEAPLPVTSYPSIRRDPGFIYLIISGVQAD